MGVWIETIKECIRKHIVTVTPCMGVWIETLKHHSRINCKCSHTLYGCVD